jgi:hypothetical protein
MVFLDKDRIVNNVQKHNICGEILSCKLPEHRIISSDVYLCMLLYG